VKVSMQLFGLAAEDYLPLVVRAEELGLECVWLADHVVTPLAFEKKYPYAASGDPGFRPETPLTDVAVTLGYLAARTSRIGLGTGVFVLPMRNPFHVARSWAALQNLSGGRAVFGVAAGWMKEEFDAVGVEFADRGARTDEMLDVLALLWSGEPVEYHGRHYDFGPVHFAGAPTAPIPLVFGGHAGPALRRAASRGTGWFGPNLDLAQTLALTRRIDRLRAQVGRGDEPFDHYVRLHGDITPAALRAYEDAGYEHLVFSPFNRLPPTSTVAEKLAALEDAVAALGAHWRAGTGDGGPS
jgi:probable F420-dependent oxidoreductase